MNSMKTRLLPLFTLCGAVAGSGLAHAATTDTTSAQATVTATIPASGAPRFSGRINEVVSLTESGVDQTIVLSYIKNSPGPFQPSADEIIRMRDAGVPTPVITAMLQRGAELREQAQAIAAAAPAQNQTYAQSTATYAQPAATTVVTPPVTYADPTYYPTYYTPSSSVVYIGGSYGYPYYYNNYCYPYYYPSYYSRVGFYGPRFNFNFGSPFRFGGGFHGTPIGGGFHGGFGGGFHGGVGGGFHGGVGGGFHGGGGGGFHGGGGGMHH